MKVARVKNTINLVSDVFVQHEILRVHENELVLLHAKATALTVQTECDIRKHSNCLS
ncbi:MAG: hypothetical protein RL632_46 [Bacteroidota bacterium]